MPQEILLPKLGLTMQEGTVAEWVARSGDLVKPGDVLMRIATDKVDVDVEAEGQGRFEPVVEEGEVLPPGALVGWLLADGEAVPAGGGGDGGPRGATGHHGRLRASPNARRVAREAGVDLASVQGTGPAGRITSEDVEDTLAAGAQTSQRPTPQPPAAAPGPPTSPLVRRQAGRHGLDLSALRGSGLGGRIRRSDVDQAAAAPAPPPATVATTSPAGPQAGQVLPLTGMRGAIARSMHASLQEMAQLTLGYEVDVDALVSLRENLKQEWAGTTLRVPALNDFVLRAAALALTEHPLLNATVRADGVHLLEEVHVGFAVALPDGLVVPVIRDADRRGLADIAQEAAALAGVARDGRLTLSQVEGATFVVTALGSYGVDFFTPVVSPGNVGILGVGRVRDGVRWEGDVPRRSQALTLSLSFDHRAVDGAPAAQFLRTVTDLLARPLLLLAG